MCTLAMLVDHIFHIFHLVDYHLCVFALDAYHSNEYVEVPIERECDSHFDVRKKKTRFISSH